MKKIYAQFLHRKKLYYFFKYYNIITKMNIKELFQEYYENDDNSTIPSRLNNNEQKDCFNLFSNYNNINSYSKLNLNSNSSIAFPYSSDSNSIFSNTERIPIKNKFQKNGLKKNIKNYPNNFEKDNIDMYMKSSSLTNRNINTNRKNEKNRRTFSYGNLEIKKDNQFYKMLNNQNNNIFNNSNIINNTQSLKAIFPTYTISSPNGLFYPIVFTNDNENYFINNNLNNNILYNYEESTPNTMNYPRKVKQKPSLWLANIFSPINQIPIIQNNNYTSPKNFNNSANFNSFPSIYNNYSEDYLNKQIYDFINANTKEKQNIITNIGKKHNFKLNKSNGAIKINDKSKTINNININKSIKKKNKSHCMMNVEESRQLLIDGVSGEKSDDKNDKKINKKNITLKNGNENNDISYMINSNDISSTKNLLNIKKSQNLKTNHFELLNSNKNNRYNGNYKKDINNSKNINKIFNNNCSIEFNKREIIKEKDNSKRTKENLIEYNKDNNKKTSNQEKYLYNGYNFNNNCKTINSINNKLNKNINNSNKSANKNSIKIYNKKGIKNKSLNNIVKKDKINFNIQNVSKETFNAKISNNIPYRNISISTFHSNENKKLFDPSLYEISNTANEEFINENNLEEKEEEDDNISDDSLKMSLQSVNDSKMLELANRYVEEGKGIDKSKINDILNDKTSQKIVKHYK